MVRSRRGPIELAPSQKPGNCVSGTESQNVKIRPHANQVMITNEKRGSVRNGDADSLPGEDIRDRLISPER